MNSVYIIRTPGNKVNGPKTHIFRKKNMALQPQLKYFTEWEMDAVKSLELESKVGNEVDEHVDEEEVAGVELRVESRETRLMILIVYHLY